MKSSEEMFDNAKRACQFLKGLANDNRLVILCALVDGEKSVGELEGILGIRQPTLSQQLARLRADELVAARRDSKQIFYSLASDEAKQVIELLYDMFCGKDTAGAGAPDPERAASDAA